MLRFKSINSPNEVISSFLINMQKMEYVHENPEVQKWDSPIKQVKSPPGMGSGKKRVPSQLEVIPESKERRLVRASISDIPLHQLPACSFL